MIIVSDKTKTQISNIPTLYAQENEKDPIVYLRFFNEKGYQWLATEYDGEDIMFGLCDLGDPELGYFSIDEIIETNKLLEKKKDLNSYFSLIKVQKFEPMKLSEAKKMFGIVDLFS
jgi:hypothetical protein